MTEETAKHHLEHSGQVTPTKESFLSIYNALQSREDKDRLFRRIVAQKDLVHEMDEDDLGRQVFNAFKLNDEAALRLVSPCREQDLETTFSDALDHYFANTFREKTQVQHFPHTAPW